MTKIAVIGGGTMGATFIRAVTDGGLVKTSDLSVCEVVPERRDWLSAEFVGIHVHESPLSLGPDHSIVYLSVKPQDLGGLQKLTPASSPVLISILAGSTIADVQASTGAERVVRAMPNTPAQIGKGFTAWTATDSVTDQERELVSRLLDAMGEQLYVQDESAIDKITAVSGSGPAYVFLIIEAMINAAVNIGLRPDDARRMVLQTLNGSAEFARESGEHPAMLKDMVTSPGGTTAAGLRVLEQRGVRSAFIDAVAAAHQRAEELGRQ
jgi:pyrroline-5-carboxylate reductase